LRRLAGAALILLVVTIACSRGPKTPFDGFRDLREGQVISYSLHSAQTRESSGLGEAQALSARLRLSVEEEATGEDTYAIVVRSFPDGIGEESQRVAAGRLVGRRLVVDLDDGIVRGSTDAFSGTDDIALADIALLSVLFAPVLPSPHVEVGDEWRTRTIPIRVPWSLRPLHLTVDNEVVAKQPYRELDSARVKSTALGNVRFRLPLVVPREPGRPPTDKDDLIVNELFESLFADIDNPIEGLAAAITAIPLAIFAPFLAFGEALGDLFGGTSEPDEPKLPVVDLSGPIKMNTNTLLWVADGRVLDANTRGTLDLSGRMPDLPGAAAELSGKTLRLKVVFEINRTHTSPFPAPRDPPGRGWAPIVAIVLTAIALALATWSTVQRRRTPV
jgi:hypothetical protein